MLTQSAVFFTITSHALQVKLDGTKQMDINATNQTEKELLAHLKANTTTKNVLLTLHPNNPQNEIKSEAVNTCFVAIDGIKKSFEYISEPFFDAVYNEFDLKSPKNIADWKKKFERR